MVDLALDPDLSAMRLDELFHDGESEADAAAIVLPRLPEVVKEMRHAVGRNSRPIVHDLEDDLLFLGGGTELHRPVFATEFDRVPDEIADDLGDTRGIGTHHCPVQRRRLEVEVTPLGEWAKGLLRLF